MLLYSNYCYVGLHELLQTFRFYSGRLMPLLRRPQREEEARSLSGASYLRYLGLEIARNVRIGGILLCGGVRVLMMV